jgi:hypothetical protein
VPETSGWKAGEAMDQQTLRQARDRYWAENDFGADGGDSKRLVPVKLGRLKLVIPNIAARRRAVRYHDLHHVLAGYGTDPGGEGEISAFELGGGCGPEWFAWVINFQGLLLGLLLRPRALLEAFSRGRHARNLYGRRLDGQLLDRTVAEVRQELGLGVASPRPSASDRALLAVWVAASLLVNLVVPLSLLAWGIAVWAG